MVNSEATKVAESDEKGGSCGKRVCKGSLTDKGKKEHAPLLLQTQIEIPLLNTLVKAL
jgi:hypothetical protein